MRTLQAQCPPDALATLDTVLKHTKDVRVFRRAQAIREVGRGQRIKAVSTAFAFTYSALRQWLQRFAPQGPQGLVDRPRPGRPRKGTEDISTCILPRVDQDPLAHGALSSQWNGRELGTAVARHTGVALHPDTIRVVLKRGA
jgi:transposase